MEGIEEVAVVGLLRGVWGEDVTADRGDVDAFFRRIVDQRPRRDVDRGMGEAVLMWQAEHHP